MPPRYNTGYGRSSSMYRYNEPSIAQYESFFNPVPLEFVQQQFDRRQGAYDEGYGMAIAAKDQFGGAKVGAPDMAYKNQLVGQFVDDTDKMVKEQYGGDWGKAAKAIARNVTQVRSNDFWRTAEIMDKRREEERALVAKYGPKALKFKSIQNQSVYDPATGKLISPDQMDYDVMERGDWEGSVAKLFAGLKGDQKAIILNKFKGDPSIQNYLQYGTTEGISDDKLRMLASDKDIINSFLSSNQDFARAAKELPDYFGSSSVDPETGKRRSAEDIASDYIYGQIKPRQYSQTQMSYTHDAGAEARAKADAESNSNPYFASFTKTPVITNPNGALAQHKKKVRGIKYNEKGDVIEEPFADNGVDPKTASLQAGLNPAYAAIANNRRTDSNEYYKELVKQYPELGNLSKKDAFEAYEKFLDKIESEQRLESNLRLEDSANNIKSQLFSNINSANFKSLQFASTGDVFDNNSIIEKLGYKSYVEFQEELKEKDISPKIDFRQAKLSITVPNRKGKGVKPETIYFDPDEQTKDMLKRAQLVTEAYYNPQTIGEDELQPMPILDYTGRPTNTAVYVEGTGNIVEGNNKTIWLVDYNNQTRRPISLEQYYEMVTKQIDTRFNNYQGKTGNPGKI